MYITKTGLVGLTLNNNTGHDVLPISSKQNVRDVDFDTRNKTMYIVQSPDVGNVSKRVRGGKDLLFNLPHLHPPPLPHSLPPPLTHSLPPPLTHSLSPPLTHSLHLFLSLPPFHSSLSICPSPSSHSLFPSISSPLLPPLFFLLQLFYLSPLLLNFCPFPFICLLKFL